MEMMNRNINLFINHLKNKSFMKKLFSLLLMTLMTVAAWATDVTFDFDNNYATLFPSITGVSSNTSHAGDFTVDVTATVNKVNLTVSPSTSGTPNRIWGTSPRLRMYGGTMTIAAPSDYKITKIVLENGKWNDGNKADTGTLSNGTWTGEAESVVITIAGNSQFKKAVVTIEEQNADALKAPTILLNGEAPKAQYSTEELPLTLTIVSNNGVETPTFSYSLLNDQATSGLSTQPRTLELGDNNVYNLKLGENTLYVNEYIEGRGSSLYATATFNITEPAQALTSLAQVNALEKDAEFVFSGDAVVLGGGGTKNLYIVDADNAAGTLLYDRANAFGADFVFGAAITPGWSGKKDVYSGKPEVVNVADLALSGQTVELTPAEVAIADVTIENFGRYAVLKGVTFDGSKYADASGATVAHYNQFGIQLPEAYEGKTYDVTGVIGYHNANQFMPLELTDVTPAGVWLAPVITVTPEKEEYTVGDEITIAIANPNDDEDAQIYYTLDGTEPTLNSEVWGGDMNYTLAEAGTFTVKAFVLSTDETQQSVVTSKALTVAEAAQVEALTTLAQVNALENNATFTFDAQLVVTGNQLSGNYRYVYVKDEAGTGGLFYNVSALANATVGTPLVGPWDGKLSIYRTLPEIVSAEGIQEASPAVEVSYDDFDIANISAADVNKVFYLRGVMLSELSNRDFTISNGDAEIAGRNTFNVEYPETVDGVTFDVLGALGIYNDALQFQPFEITAVDAPQVIEITFDPEGGEIESGTVVKVNVTGLVEGDVVKYFIDNEAEQDYPEEGVTITGEAGQTVMLGVFVYGADGAMKQADRTSYTLTAAPEPFEAATFALVTSADELEAGKKYIIVAAQEGEDAVNYFAMSISQNTNNRKAVAVTPNEDETITSTEDIEVITLGEGSQEGTWTLGVNGGYLYAASSSSNHMKTEAEADANADAAITIGDETSIVFQGENTRNVMRFNPNNNSPIFSCYASTSTVGVTPLLYKQVEEQPEVTDYYLTGAFNNWGQNGNENIKFEANEDGDLAASVELPAGNEDGENGFKVIAYAEDGSTVWYGGEDANKVGYFKVDDDLLGVELSLKPGAEYANLIVKEAGQYDLILKEAEANAAAGAPAKAPAAGLKLIVTKAEELPTAVTDIAVENIASVQYVNLAGQVSAAPFQGVNIMVTTMKDGSKKAVKVVK